MEIVSYLQPSRHFSFRAQPPLSSTAANSKQYTGAHSKTHFTKFSHESVCCQLNKVLLYLFITQLKADK